MKQRIAICLIFAMLLTLLCACNGNQPGTQMSAEESSHGTEAVSDPAESSSPAESGESGVSEMEIAQTGWTEAVPASYTQAAAEQGAVVRLYYESEDYVRDSSPITKTAYVYTPYGYDEKDTETRYNILYLMHGWGGHAGKNPLLGYFRGKRRISAPSHAVCPVTAVQNRYSMMARWHESLFCMLEKLHIGYVAFSPLANGFLSEKYDEKSKFEQGTDYRSSMPQFSAEGVKQNRELLALLEKVGEEKHATPAQISLAWMLCKRPSLVAIPGTRKSERLRENAGAAEIELSPEELAHIDCALNHMEMSAVFGGAKIIK